ncbi:hypothetical protein Emag_001211 [Eimeria magna]
MTEALGKAVLRGDAEAVRRHLEEGADPSALNKKGAETKARRDTQRQRAYGEAES